MIDEPFKPLSVLDLRGFEIIPTGLKKDKKLTLGSGQFQSFCGAGGIRTLVRKWNCYAFYMLIETLVFELSWLFLIPA